MGRWIGLLVPVLAGLLLFAAAAPSSGPRSLAGWGALYLLTSAALLGVLGRYLAMGRVVRPHPAEADERAWAEAALGARGEQFRMLFEQSPVGIGVARDGVLVSANRAFLELFRYSRPEEVAGRRMLEHMVPRERVTQIGHILRQVRGEPVEASGEHTGLRRDGTTFPMICNIVRASLPNNEECLIGFFTDLTPLKRAEEERDQFFTLSRNLLCVVGYDGYFKRLNPAWEATLGLTIEELMAEPCRSVIHPDDHEATFQALDAGAASRSVVGLENRFRCKDGSYRWLSWSYTVLPERQIAFGVAQDVTERKRTEQEQQRLYQVAEGLREVIAVINSRQSLNAVLQFVIAQASRLLTVEAGVIYRLASSAREDAAALRVEAAYGLDPRYLGVTIANAERTICYEAIRQRAPVALADAGRVMDQLLAEGVLGPQYQPMLAELRRRMSAILTVPLVIKDEIYGTITLYDSRVRSFNEEEIKLAVSFARQSALAIENGWLRQQVRQTAIREERSRLARELHDSVTQSLYSQALLAEGWRLAAQEARLDQVAGQFERLGTLTQQTLREMRLLIHQLRPPELHREGLVRALKRRLDAVERRLGIDACLRVDGELALTDTVEEQLYWIVQEALNNALKHAGATAVTVSLCNVDLAGGAPAGQEVPGMEVEVRDNGKGFDPTTMARGFGLDSMRERAEQMGATLAVDAAPGCGTCVRVTCLPSEKLYG